MASALFSINNDGTNQGFVAEVGSTITLKLRENPTVGVSSVLYQVFDATGFNPGSQIALNPPRQSPGAPELTLNNGAGSTGRSVAPNGFLGEVTAVMPSSAPHSWIIRCVVNGGMKILPNGQTVPDPSLIQERMVSVLNGVGARAVPATERTQFSNDGIADAIQKIVDGTPTARLATADATVTTIWEYTPPANCAVRMMAVVTGKRNSDNKKVVYHRSRWFDVVAGVVSALAAAEDISSVEDAALAAADATIDTDGTKIRVRVTGIAATAMTWRVVTQRFDASLA